ncbi:MAG TPA: type IV toxin-antitoxin system AbiEi family antitoxin domain-containing protein, partial [Solirubrobacterales bacterium]|nr:type IV toxin-antitoxin system AbiEi family antitoxin domain-containing protein [Solirubrobacterales bacterium]
MGRKRNHHGREARVAEAATAQGGVVSLDQLREIGVSSDAAEGQERRGLLHRVHRGVYAVGHEALERPAFLRAAVLACRDGAVLSH